MAASDTKPHPDNPAPEEELPPVRRSFPVPRRREVPEAYEEPVPLGQHWAMRGLLAVAIIMAGAAAWFKFHPDNTPAPAPPVIAAPDPPPSGPPDAARDIYLSAVPPDPPPTLTPTLTPTPTESPPSPARTLTNLDARYAAALTAAMSHLPEADRAPFTAEIERLHTGAPLPPPRDGTHPELTRLRSIYRLQLAKKPSAEP